MSNIHPGVKNLMSCHASSRIGWFYINSSGSPMPKFKIIFYVTILIIFQGFLKKKIVHTLSSLWRLSSNHLIAESENTDITLWQTKYNAPCDISIIHTLHCNNMMTTNKPRYYLLLQWHMTLNKSYTTHELHDS